MTAGVAPRAGSASKAVLAPAARELLPRSMALLICVGLALFVVAARLEAAVGAFAASSPSVGAVQLAVAVLVGLAAARVARSPRRRALRAGAAGAGVLAAVWIALRASGQAPVGLLDAMTALDELLLALFALAASRGRGTCREGWSLLASVAISLSFVVLAMGCEPAVAPASDADGPAPLICHL